MFINRGLMASPPGGNSSPHRTFLKIIQDASLATNLKFCLDAGDAQSYTGAGTSWLDTSGNGQDFFRGATASAEATDPSFVGVPGHPSKDTCFTFDGGDYFRYDTTNETWMNNLHKNNAIFSMACWINFSVIGGTGSIFGTKEGGAVNTGVHLRKAANDRITYFVSNAGATVSLVSPGTALSALQWYFIGFSINEATGANGMNFQINGTQAQGTSTYSSPSAAAATYTMELGAMGNADSPLPADSKMATFAMWEGTQLSLANLDTIYQASRGRFGV